MSNITVSSKELKDVLDAIPSNQNIMLVGNHGIGKSEILTSYFEDKGMKVVALFLGQMSDPGDLIGLPMKNENTGRTEFAPPYWFPIDGQPICLFLDELNRARPEILQTVMDLTLNRTLAGKRLPEGSRVIAAVNEGQRYQLTDLDPALVSRFNIVNFTPTVQEWLLWAKRNQLDERIISFIEENPVWLDGEPDSVEDADRGLDKTPDRRAWKRASDIIKGHKDINEIYSKVLASVVGSKATSFFLSTIHNRKLVSAKDLLMHYSEYSPKLNDYQVHELSIVNEAIYRFLEVEKVDKEKTSQVSSSVEKYFDWLVDNRKEAAAHFASLYTKDIYSNAVSFMATNARLLTYSIISYVRTIQ